MSRNDDNRFLASKSPTRCQQRPLVPSTNGPILLPNLSPRPTFDVDQLGSPEFRDAVQAAKESRSNNNPSNHLSQPCLPLDSLLRSHHAISSHGTHDSEGDHTRRMQTRVAVRDYLKSPHHFQVVPLHEVKKLRVPVRPKPPVSSRKPSTSREKRKTFMAPESHGWSGNLALTSVYTAGTVNPTATESGSTPFKMPSYPLDDKLANSHSANSIINGQDPCTYDTTGTSECRRRRESIAQLPRKISLTPPLASLGDPHRPHGLPHKSRGLSMSSSLGSSHDLTSSSSLRDIQIRAASSTKSRRTQMQTLSNDSAIPANSLRSRKSLSNLRTSDGCMDENTREAFAKRRAIYTGSMYLDSSAMSDANVRGLWNGDGDPNAHTELSASSFYSWSSVLPKTEDTRRNLRNTCPHLSNAEDIPKRRTPLASIDLNVQTKSQTPRASMPSSTSSVSRSSSFLFRDPFARPTMHRRQNSETAYHPIVLELLAALDVAIREWNAV